MLNLSNVVLVGVVLGLAYHLSVVGLGAVGLAATRGTDESLHSYRFGIDFRENGYVLNSLKSKRAFGIVEIDLVRDKLHYHILTNFDHSATGIALNYIESDSITSQGTLLVPKKVPFLSLVNVTSGGFFLGFHLPPSTPPPPFPPPPPP